MTIFTTPLCTSVSQTGAAGPALRAIVIVLAGVALSGCAGLVTDKKTALVPGLVAPDEIPAGGRLPSEAAPYAGASASGDMPEYSEPLLHRAAEVRPGPVRSTPDGPAVPPRSAGGEPRLAQTGAGATKTANPSEPDLAVLAQKANNPISDAWLLITQNDTTLIEGDSIDGTKVANVVKFQPVLSAPIFGGDWNFVVRPVLQFSSMPLNDQAGDLFGAAPNDIVADSGLATAAADPYGRTTGLGDTVLLTLVGPNSDDGWIFAGGASQIFPTASDDVLGQGKWQAGPAALVARLGNDYGGFGVEHFNVGFLAQQWWSYAGDDDRGNTNQADIQYFMNWKATPTGLIGMTPNISVNWNADGGFSDKVAFPVGLGYIGVFKIGDMPVRWGVEGQYYLTGNDAIKRTANLKVFIAPIVPNLFK